jgi:hypothetical protein
MVLEEFLWLAFKLLIHPFVQLPNDEQRSKDPMGDFHMKSIFLITYIASALFISTQARADIAFNIPARVEGVTIDPSTLTLNVYGTLSNPCAKTIVTMKEDANEKAVLVVTVSALASPDVCIAMVKDYQEKISLPTLIKESQTEIDPAQGYLIRVSNVAFEYQVTGAQLLL